MKPYKCWVKSKKCLEIERTNDGNLDDPDGSGSMVDKIVAEDRNDYVGDYREEDRAEGEDPVQDPE